MMVRGLSRIPAAVLVAIVLSFFLLVPRPSWPAPPQWHNTTGGVTDSGTCPPGGSASAGSCPSWGGFVKTMPGTICTMNIGNASPTAGYTNKIRNCSEADARKQSIGGTNCDVINIIEINTSKQCECACDPANTCTNYTDLFDGLHHLHRRSEPARDLQVRRLRLLRAGSLRSLPGLSRREQARDMSDAGPVLLRSQRLRHRLSPGRQQRL